ncbi:MAG: hypothetical protein ACRDLO_01760, partial [Solirubrobacterales bacterium]
MADPGVGPRTLLIYGDTERSAALRHELPLSIIDPLLFAIVDGRRHAMTSILERERIAAVAPDAELHEIGELGFGELLQSGMSWTEIDLELASRAARRIGVTTALVDPEFPLLVADRLCADGIELTPDAETFEARRRVKSPAELEGIRRAQRAAEAGMAAAAALLRSAVVDGEALLVDGGTLTAESVRAALREACAARGAPAPPDAIVASVRQGFGHEAGSG